MNYTCSIILIIIGIYALITKKDTIKSILGIGIIAYGIKLLVVTSGFKLNATAPLFAVGEIMPETFFVDPLAQVIAYIVTAFFLVFASTAITFLLKIHSTSSSDIEFKGRD